MKKLFRFFAVLLVVSLTACSGLQVTKPEVAKQGDQVVSLEQLVEKSGANVVRAFTALTGGGTGSLDKISRTTITNGDIAMVVTGNIIYFYQYNSAATDAEASPTYIRPNDFATEGVWYLVDVIAKNVTAARVAGAASSAEFFEVPANGNEKVTIKAPDALAADYVSTLPSATGTLALVSGALGTPSFTAVNLPSSSADPATTGGQIKHKTITDEANSGGVAKWYDGFQVRSLVDTGTNYTVIVKTEFLPIAWAVNGATAPSDLAAVTGKEINARSFTEADDVVFWWIVPNDYVGGIRYRVLYALAANASSGDTAVFSMAGSIIANSGDLDGSAGTALTISDELTTDDDQYQFMATDFSLESNSDWSLVASGLARLNFSHAAASDMVGAGEPLVVGIEIKYKAKVIGIAGY